jgi:ketopantoate reductase
VDGEPGGQINKVTHEDYHYMRITIIGSGAMGGLFGSLLAQGGSDVVLIDIDPDHIAAINCRGLGVEFEGKTRWIDIKASIDIQAGKNADLAIVFVKSPQTKQAAVKEASDVALAHGIRLADDMIEQVYHAARATSPNRSSMGQDIDHKRPTEIDAINGAVVRLAQAKNIPVPVNQTLTALIQTLQQNYT